MPLLPISATRTSTPLTTQRLLFQLNSDQIELQRSYDQLSTGRRVLRLSDDPAAANRALGLYQGIDRGHQLARNTASTASFYQGTDSALAHVNTALVEARGATIEASQTTTSQDQREALSATIREAINSVFAAGNSVFRDHQLLGGFLNAGTAFSHDGNEILFSGSNAIGRTYLGSGNPLAINLNGTEGLGVNAAFMESDSLDAALNAESRLIDLRKGEGVTTGVIRFSGGTDWVELDLRSAATIGEVAELISEVEVEGRQLTASLTNEGIRVEYADGLSGTLAIADATGSTMAEELAISNPEGFDPPPIIGDRLSPRITPATLISDLKNGAGLNLDDGIQLIQGDETFVIDLAQAETLSDVLIAINRSDADVRAELNETDGSIVLRALRSGVDYAVGENGGIAAQELGIRTATTQTRLSELGRGRGLVLNPNDTDLIITRPDGRELELDLDGLEDIQDVIDAIRNHPRNQDTLRVLVDLNDFGNGLQLKAPPGPNSLTVREVGLSDAGVRLGLIPLGSNTNSGSIVGPVETLVGVDYAPQDAGGALDTLLRLETSIRDGDIPEIERLQKKLDTDFERANRARGRVGVWAKNLNQLQEVSEGKVIQLRKQLSNELDADMAAVISEVTQRQITLEASMRIIGQTSQLTVLNFL